MKRLSCLLVLFSLFVLQTPALGQEASPQAAPQPASQTAAATANIRSWFNVVANPGAEQYGTSDTHVYSWTAVGTSIKTTPWGQPFPWPQYTDAGPTCRGKQLYIGGTNSIISGGYQERVMTNDEIAQIDAGNMQVTLSGWLGGILTQPDYPLVTTSFFDGSGNSTGSSLSLPIVLPADRNNATKLLFKSASADIPTGTRKVRVTLLMMNNDYPTNSYNYAIADNISLYIEYKNAPTYPFNYNLLPNGNAEDNTDCARDTPGGNPNAVVSPVGWTVTTGNMTVVQYGTAGFPQGTIDDTEAEGGLLFFAGGPNSYYSIAEYLVDLSSLPKWMIQDGKIYYTAGGMFGGYADQADLALLRVNFMDKNSQLISTFDMGGYTAAQRENKTMLKYAGADGYVPGGTSSIQFQLIMVRPYNDTSYNDGYADRMNFFLYPPTLANYMPILFKNYAPPVPGPVKFINNAPDPIISLVIDSVEQFPSSPLGIVSGGSYSINLGVGAHTYTAWTGFWQPNGQRYPRWKITGNFYKNVPELDIPLNVTIMDELTYQKSSGYWLGNYWYGTNFYEVHFCFYPNGAYIFSQSSGTGWGTYALVYWGDYADKFRLTDHISGQYDGLLYHDQGMFDMTNGPGGMQITYYYQPGASCPAQPILP